MQPTAPPIPGGLGTGDQPFDLEETSNDEPGGCITTHQNASWLPVLQMQRLTDCLN